jgi:transposase-like protein
MWPRMPIIMTATGWEKSSVAAAARRIFSGSRTSALDETYVKVSCVWRYVYLAVDPHGQLIDVLLSARRDTAAARRFFTRALRH